MPGTAESATTELAPVTGAAELLPPPGRYPLRRDRCVVELAARPVWGRITVLSGELVVDAEGTHSITAELATNSLRTNIPLLASRLSGPRVLSFAATDLVADNGKLLITATAPTDLVLTARVVHLGDESVVLSASGVLRGIRSPRLGPLARLLLRRRIAVRIAVEFAK